MKRFSYLILTFALLFLVFFIGLVFLRTPFITFPLMSLQDVFDILTPLVLLVIYLLLYRISPQTPLSLSGLILFTIFAAFWAAGQGMHLSANSIDNLLGKMGLETGDVYKLTYFYDETLSHYLWHIGIFGLSAMLVYRHWKNPFTVGQPLLWPVVVGGIIHGLSFFLITMEGNTWPLGVPFSLLMVLFILIVARKRLSQQPLVLFFFIAYALNLLLFIIWLILYGWPPPPPMDVIKI